jgi:uncharacterized protein YqjF (DUF2071 family)
MELKDGVEISVRVETTTRVQTARVVKPDLPARRALQQEPNATPVMFQTWSDLLFLHWEWDPAEIQATLPPGLYVDTYGEKAYVGVTPFRMTDVRASFLPPLPGVTNFLELNVRTYVHDANGRPGVWFYSLDLNHGLGVAMAKVFYSLPYHSATIEAEERAGLIQYRCQRQTAPEATLLFYRKEPKTIGAPPGSLPFFLAERYLLYSYSQRTRKLYAARVHHSPWELFQAHVGKYDETMLRLNHLNPRLRPPDHHWYGSPVRVKIYALQEA